MVDLFEIKRVIPHLEFETDGSLMESPHGYFYWYYNGPNIIEFEDGKQECDDKEEERGDIVHDGNFVLGSGDWEKEKVAEAIAEEYGVMPSIVDLSEYPEGEAQDDYWPEEWEEEELEEEELAKK